MSSDFGPSQSVVGFTLTLLKLMFVVAITGILTALAIPVYHRYMTTSELTEAFSLESNAQSAVLIHHASDGCCAEIKNPAASRGVCWLASDKASLNARLMSTTNRMRRKRRGITDPQRLKNNSDAELARPVSIKGYYVQSVAFDSGWSVTVKM